VKRQGIRFLLTWGIMNKERRAFNFLKSYYDIFKMLPNDKSKAEFIAAICEKQFNGENPESEKMDPMAYFAYMSQKHSIDASRQGFEDVGNRWEKPQPNNPPKGTPTVGAIVTPKGTPTVQEQVQVQEKEQEKVKVQNKFSFRSALLSLGVDSVLVDEWIKVRKAKKAVNTETAFNALKREVEKSGLVANICIKIAVEKSWSGFNAEWINNTISQKKQVGHEASRMDFSDNTL
jgi:hypothetical protein